MEKIFTKLKLKDYLTLAVLVILSFIWIMIDQYFISSSSTRFAALIVLMLFLFSLQYMINRPLRILAYANTIALITFSAVVILSFIQHIVIKHDFALKVMLIWLTVIVLSYAGGAIYFLYVKLTANQDVN